MELIDAKCPNCGSVIKINRVEKTGVCEHCNSSFLIDEAVKNYITNNYIEHATIIKNDFGDDVLFNEIDKYIAQASLNNLDGMKNIVENLKEKFPHKGIARITVLHFEIVNLFIQHGDEEAFYKECNRMEKVCSKYKPKSYKHTPPLSKYLTDNNEIVEIQYADDIEELLTDEEKSKYENLINKTLEYVEYYTILLDYNKEMYKKFEPYQKKFDKKAAKYDNPKAMKQRFIKTKAWCVLISLALIIALAALIFYRTYYVTKKDYIEVDASSLSNLEAPLMTPGSERFYKEYSKSSVQIESKHSYSISGRVVGKTDFLPLDMESKVMTSSIAIAWGELTPEEKSSKIDWNCSLFTKDIKYSWNPNLGNSDYIQSYFSSNSLIPADEIVAKKIRTIRKNDLVQITGYLVDVYVSSNNGKSYYWESSTSLHDHRAEIIYVTDVNWIR